MNEQTPNLNRYHDHVYADHKYGDPELAAQKLSELIVHIEEQMLDAKRIAGTFLSPGVIAAFRVDLSIMLNEVSQKPSSKFPLSEQKSIENRT